MAAPGAARRPSPRAAWGPGRVLRKSRLTLVGLLICLPIAVVAGLAPAIAPYDPQVMNVKQRLLPPSLAHPMGTDLFGRDTLSRVIYGARVSLDRKSVV